jgi:hypothetical protein
VGTGFSGEACTGGSDGFYPSAPTVSGAHVWYAALVSACYAFTSQLYSYAVSPVGGRSGELAGTVLELTKDGGILYALVAPPNSRDQWPACDAPETPCKIQRVGVPKLQPVSGLPRSPFF